MVLETVGRLLADYKHIDPDRVTREAVFADLGIDSLDTVDLVIQIEETFHIIIEQDDAIETVGELVDIIEKQLSQEVNR